jgi:hypothetical protein
MLPLAVATEQKRSRPSRPSSVEKQPPVGGKDSQILRRQDRVTGMSSDLIGGRDHDFRQDYTPVAGWNDPKNANPLHFNGRFSLNFGVGVLGIAPFIAKES